jgi:hypothetical protein
MRLSVEDRDRLELQGAIKKPKDLQRALVGYWNSVDDGSWWW